MLACSTEFSLNFALVCSRPYESCIYIWKGGEQERNCKRLEPKGDGLCLCYSQTSLFFCQSKSHRYSHRFDLCLTLSLWLYLWHILWSDLVAVANNTKTHRCSHTLWYSHTLSVSITSLFNLSSSPILLNHSLLPTLGQNRLRFTTIRAFPQARIVRKKLCRIQRHLRKTLR